MEGMTFAISFVFVGFSSLIFFFFFWWANKHHLKTITLSVLFYVFQEKRKIKTEKTKEISICSLTYRVRQVGVQLESVYFLFWFYLLLFVGCFHSSCLSINKLDDDHRIIFWFCECVNFKANQRSSAWVNRRSFEMFVNKSEMKWHLEFVRRLWNNPLVKFRIVIGDCVLISVYFIVFNVTAFFSKLHWNLTSYWFQCDAFAIRLVCTNTVDTLIIGRWCEEILHLKSEHQLIVVKKKLVENISQINLTNGTVCLSIRQAHVFNFTDSEIEI